MEAVGEGLVEVEVEVVEEEGVWWRMCCFMKLAIVGVWFIGDVKLVLISGLGSKCGEGESQFSPSDAVKIRC
jgi:hypothetical protein